MVHLMSKVSVPGALLVSAPALAGLFPSPSYLMDGRWARWNDDGSRIVFTLDTTYSNFNRPNVFTANADGSDRTQITFFRGNEAFGQYGSAHGPSYRPGTSEVYWRDDRDGAWYMAHAQDDGSTSRNRTTISGHHTPIRFNPDGNKWAFVYNPSFSGNRIYVGTGDPASGYSTVLTGSGIRDVEWGAGINSETLAYTKRQTQSSVSSLWLVGSNGSGATRMTDDAFGNVRNPAWSPDGSTVFFSRELDGQWDLWSMELASGDLRQWTDDAHHPQYPTISPDGSTLMYTVNFPDESTDVNVYRLYTLDLSFVPAPASASVLIGTLFVFARRDRRGEES